MKLFHILLAAVAIAHEGHDHDHAEDEGPSDVVTLTDKSFDGFVKDNSLSLIEFYAPWCGHCKALKPEYEKAATELKDKVPIAKVDCTVEKESCEKHGIQGFPTLKIFRDGTPSEYKGQRTSASIVEVMKRQLLPAVSVLKDQKAVDAFIAAEKVVIVGSFKGDSKEKKAFETVAKKLRDDFVFGSTESDKQKIVLHKKFDEGKNVFDGEYTAEAITKFIQTNSVPIMDDIGPHNYEKYVSSGLPIAYFFHGTADQKKEFGPIFEKVAKEYKSKMLFVYLDASMYGGHAENLALKQEWPAFGIQNIETSSKYPFDQTKTITEESIAEFVKNVAEGKIESTLKSEPVPEPNDEPVTVIVGKTFEEIVKDENKDVLIEFYAPWCGHCKKLAPVWDELGAAVKSDKIVIAKMDATQNDAPGVDIQGFPTIMLFKAKDNTIVKFNGDRTLDGFVSFLKENAVHASEIGEIESSDSDDSEEHSEL